MRKCTECGSYAFNEGQTVELCDRCFLRGRIAVLEQVSEDASFYLRSQDVLDYLLNGELAGPFKAMTADELNRQIADLRSLSREALRKLQYSLSEAGYEVA